MRQNTILNLGGKLPSGQTSLGLVNYPTGECWKRIKLQIFYPEYEFIIHAYCYSNVWNFDTEFYFNYTFLYDSRQNTILNLGVNCLQVSHHWTWLMIPLENVENASNFGFLILKMNLLYLLIFILAMFDEQVSKNQYFCFCLNDWKN